MAAWELAAYELLSNPGNGGSHPRRDQKNIVLVSWKGPTPERSIQDKSTEQAQRWQGLGKWVVKVNGRGVMGGECQKLRARCRLLNSLPFKRSQGQWDLMNTGLGIERIWWNGNIFLGSNGASAQKLLETGNRKARHGQSGEWVITYQVRRKLKDSMGPYAHKWMNERMNILKAGASGNTFFTEKY